MADEQNNPSVTPTEPLGNAPEARNPDGSIKDTQTTQPGTTTPTEPAKTDAAAKTDGKTDPAAKTDKPVGPPEKYEAFTVPEGYELNKDLLTKAEPIFRELGLTQDAAQKLVSLYSEAAVAAAQEPLRQYEATREAWRGEVVKDPTLGNGTDDLKPEVKAVLARTVDSLPPKDAEAFREVLTITGAGDNPAFIRAFYQLAQRMTEGGLVKGTGPSALGQNNPARPPSAAQALFPNLPSAS